MTQGGGDLRTDAVLTTDQQTLLAAACANEASSAQFGRLASEVTNWRYVTELAARHGLVPLLHERLRTLQEGVVPSEIADHLRDQSKASITWNLVLTSHLLELVGECEANGIRVVPFKGLVVAAAYYEKPACRPAGDIDVIVDPRQMKPAARLLERLGYLFESECDYHKKLVRRDVPVELHWRFAPWRFRLPLQFDEVWQRVERVQLSGREVTNLSAEDAAILLSVHGARHLWERLVWLVDLARLIRRRPELNWTLLLERARSLGCERVVLLGLALCNELLTTALPDSVLDRIRADQQIPMLVTIVTRRLFQASPTEISQSERDLFSILVREKMRDRIRYCYPHRPKITQHDAPFFPFPMRFWTAASRA